MFEKNVHLARKWSKIISSALHFVSTAFHLIAYVVYCTLFSILVPELSARLYCIVQHQGCFSCGTICKLLCYLPTQAQGQFGVQTQPETRQASAFSLHTIFFISSRAIEQASYSKRSTLLFSKLSRVMPTNELTAPQRVQNHFVMPPVKFIWRIITTMQSPSPHTSFRSVVVALESVPSAASGTSTCVVGSLPTTDAMLRSFKWYPGDVER